jgi:hypothetical protein
MKIIIVLACISAIAVPAQCVADEASDKSWNESFANAILLAVKEHGSDGMITECDKFTDSCVTTAKFTNGEGDAIAFSFYRQFYSNRNVRIVCKYRNTYELCFDWEHPDTPICSRVDGTGTYRGYYNACPIKF